MTTEKKHDVLVGIPCFNEEKTIGKVVLDFKREFSGARILVVDNNSSDGTSVEAMGAGAEVATEKKRGKGFAVQKIFDNFKEDVLILVDGDDTYFATDAKKLVGLVVSGQADMAVGNRVHFSNAKNFKFGHWIGNKFLTKMVNILFGTNIQDMESGLRAMNRKYVQSSALLAGGFGIEPELTIQALEKNFTIKEHPISIKTRDNSSESKLRTVRDGIIVVYTILSLFRDNKPLQFFSFIGLIFFIVAGFFGQMSIDSLEFSYIFFCGLFALFGFISFVAGLILSSLKRKHEELIVLMRRKRE